MGWPLTQLHAGCVLDFFFFSNEEGCHAGDEGMDGRDVTQEVEKNRWTWRGRLLFTTQIVPPRFLFFFEPRRTLLDLLCFASPHAASSGGRKGLLVGIRCRDDAG